MGIDINSRNKAKQTVKVGLKTITGELDAVTTKEIIQLHTSVEKISWQSDGTLAGILEFSINGVDFEGLTAFTATTIGSYSTHCICVIRVTRTAGTGKLHIAAK